MHSNSSRSVPVAVLGASGYSGAELLRLLAAHPSLKVSFVGAHDAAGKPLGAVWPHLAPFAELVLQPNEDVADADVEAAFLALPAGRSSAIAPELAERGVRVVDIGSDFRLAPNEYPEWYGFEHTAPAWTEKAVYGLTEVFRDEVRGSTLVANPGCYPTPVVLGLHPLFAAGLVEGDVIVDGKSGISGAGKQLTEQSQFASLDGSVRAYKVGRHQHTPEMERSLATTGRSPAVTFVPHLVPAVRGIVTTSYVAAIGDAEQLRGALHEAYDGEPFVRVLPAGETPDPKRLAGSNAGELAVEVDAHGGRATAIVIGAIDNLGKGAAGQALQNMNVMLGLDETFGLSAIGVYP